MKPPRRRSPVVDQGGFTLLEMMIAAAILATMLAVPQNLLRLLTAAPQRLLMALEARKRKLGE